MSGKYPFRTLPGYGAHEVVVESPRHETTLADLAPDQVRPVFGVYRARLEHFARDKKLLYVQIFKNHGAAAGASVEHVHSQILGLPRVPREVAAELTGACAHHARFGQCAYCDLIDSEFKSGERLVATNDHALAIAAFAGRFPYEVLILPQQHSSHFDSATTRQLDALSDLIRAVLSRLNLLIENVSYNLVLHTAPLHQGPRPDYHWHWELLPRTTGIAGFEISTGWFVNPLPPEIAAERLRG
jgi:UDPglucose--hexose-1-phosphate uridylyltransferase